MNSYSLEKSVSPPSHCLLAFAGLHLMYNYDYVSLSLSLSLSLSWVGSSFSDGGGGGGGKVQYKKGTITL